MTLPIKTTPTAISTYSDKTSVGLLTAIFHVTVLPPDGRILCEAPRAILYAGRVAAVVLGEGYVPIRKQKVVYVGVPVWDVMFPSLAGQARFRRRQRSTVFGAFCRLLAL